MNVENLKPEKRVPTNIRYTSDQPEDLKCFSLFLFIVFLKAQMISIVHNIIALFFLGGGGFRAF